MLSKRANELDVSGIRKVFSLAAKLKNPVNLSIGQPDFDVPEQIKKQAIEHIQMGHNKYTQSAGIPELRELVQNNFKAKGIKSEDVVITSGVSGGISLAVQALIDPGDEVLVADPYFVMYEAIPKLYGGKIVLIDTYPDFQIDPQKLKEVITPKTKLLFLNSPANPTGIIMGKERLQEIAKVLEGTGILVISDEIYDVFDYEQKHSYFASLYEKTITLGGFSKTLGMTGWRVGYALGPKEIIDTMIKLQQYTFVCAPSFAQYASLQAFDIDQENMVRLYKEKRDFVYSSLKDKYQIIKPDGAFYFFIKHPVFNGDDLAMKALEKNIMLIPGSVFSNKNTHFRLSFSNTMEELEKGMEGLSTI